MTGSPSLVFCDSEFDECSEADGKAVPVVERELKMPDLAKKSDCKFASDRLLSVHLQSQRQQG